MTNPSIDEHVKRLWSWAERNDFPLLRDSLGLIVGSGFMEWARYVGRLAECDLVVAWDCLERIAGVFGKILERPKEYDRFSEELIWNGSRGLETIRDWGWAWGYPELSDRFGYLIASGGKLAWDAAMEALEWASEEMVRDCVRRLVNAIESFRKANLAKVRATAQKAKPAPAEAEAR